MFITTVLIVKLIWVVTATSEVTSLSQTRFGTTNLEYRTLKLTRLQNLNPKGMPFIKEF